MNWHNTDTKVFFEIFGEALRNNIKVMKEKSAVSRSDIERHVHSFIKARNVDGEIHIPQVASRL